MTNWLSDAEVFRLMRTELFTAVVGDVMDKMGLQTQFLPPYLSVLDRSMIIAGRAMTVLEADVFEETSEGSANPLMSKPFGLMFEALDSLSENDVYICSGSSIFSPSLNAVVGAEGVAITSTSAKAFAKSCWMRVRTFCALP